MPLAPTPKTNPSQDGTRDRQLQPGRYAFLVRTLKDPRWNFHAIERQAAARSLASPSKSSTSESKLFLLSKKEERRRCAAPQNAFHPSAST